MAAAADANAAVEAADTRAAELRGACEALRDERGVLQKALGEAQAEVMALRNELEAARGEVEDAAAAAKERETEAVASAGELARARAASASQSLALGEATTELARVQGALDAVNRDHAAVHATLKGVLGDKRTLAAEVDTLTRELAESRRLLSEWETTAHRHEAGTKGAQEELAAVAQSLTQTRRERDRARKEVTSVQRRLEELQRAHSKVRHWG